jgi:choline dehydrogenase-like flavoprotein
MDHPTQLSWALAKEPVFPYRGPLSTGGIEGLRDGPFRRNRGAFRIEIGNDGWTWPVGDMTQIGGKQAASDELGWKLVATLRERALRHLRLAALVEQLPDPENRVTASDNETDTLGIPRPVIKYRVSEYTREGMAAARQAMQDLYDAMGATQVQFAEDFFGAGHIMGTYRMGRDPKTSVVNADERSHDHPNLFLLGSGVFPTVGCSNPSLTIAALTLRTAEVIKSDFAA